MDLDPNYEYPIDWINHARAAGQPAGIYLLDGVVRLALRFSAAEEALRAAGALYVATLAFGPTALEGTRPGATVRRTAAGAFLAWAGAEN